MLLQIQELSKAYTTQDGIVTALDGVSLSVSAGEMVAIVGRSGSGKTTLLNMIGGLDVPDKGRILLDGQDIVRLSDKQASLLRRRRIGIIYQFYNLIPELNVRENITLPVELDGGEIDEGWLSEILSIVGLSDRGRAYPDTLSGGQQQRVAVARALFNRPGLILADEPAGNLDAENGEEVMRLLSYMNRELGATVLIVTHSERVAAAAGRVITLAEGRILSDRGVDA